VLLFSTVEIRDFTPFDMNTPVVGEPETLVPDIVWKPTAASRAFSVIVKRIENPVTPARVISSQSFGGTKRYLPAEPVIFKKYPVSTLLE
jgi:hypothetical protein